MATRNLAQRSQRSSSDAKVAVYNAPLHDPETDNQQWLQKLLGIALISLSAITTTHF